MNQNTVIREIHPSDYHLLEVFIYEAIFVPPGAKKLPKEIIFEPSVFMYIEAFGKEGDCGVVAEQSGKIIGVAWTRIIPGYGHVDTRTPELAISILPKYRGKGVGQMLLAKLFKVLVREGYEQTSLAVQKENAAYRLYERVGYKVMRESEEEYLMIKDLAL